MSLLIMTAVLPDAENIVMYHMWLDSNSHTFLIREHILNNPVTLKDGVQHFTLWT